MGGACVPWGEWGGGWPHLGSKLNEKPARPCLEVNEGLAFLIFNFM